MYCVVASSWKNSTTWELQPVTSRASCSDRGALAGQPVRDRVDAARTDQVADVRHDPIRAGLDELVVVELRQVLFQRQRLVGQHLDERAQTASRRLVADAVERW
jgi:hypothetical protein